MKSLFHINIKTPLIAALLIFAPALVAKAQDSRIQMGSLDHLAAKASQTVDVNIDERLMQMAAKLFSDKDADEREIKKLIAGLKGIYVKSFEFETDGQYVAADLEPIRTQLRGARLDATGQRQKQERRKARGLSAVEWRKVGGLAVLASDDKELTVVNIVGPVDLDKLAKLEGQLGVPELGIESSKTKKKNDETVRCAMKTIATKSSSLVFVVLLTSAPVVHAKGDDFNSVVKMIEAVLPREARGDALPRESGNEGGDHGCADQRRYRQGELQKRAASSSRCLKIRSLTAISRSFAASLNAALNETWMPLVQTVSATTKNRIISF